MSVNVTARNRYQQVRLKPVHSRKQDVAVVGHLDQIIGFGEVKQRRDIERAHRIAGRCDDGSSDPLQRRSNQANAVKTCPGITSMQAERRAYEFERRFGEVRSHCWAEG